MGSKVEHYRLGVDAGMMALTPWEDVTDFQFVDQEKDTVSQNTAGVKVKVKGDYLSYSVRYKEGRVEWIRISVDRKGFTVPTGLGEGEVTEYVLGDPCYFLDNNIPSITHQEWDETVQGIRPIVPGYFAACIASDHRRTGVGTFVNASTRLGIVTPWKTSG